MMILEENPWLQFALMTRRMEQPKRRFRRLFYRRGGSWICALCGESGPAQQPTKLLPFSGSSSGLRNKRKLDR